MALKWERWNREELAILKEHFPNTSREDIMRLLPGRTWRAIVHQAETQEVRRPHYDTVRSKEYLAELHITLSTARTNRTSGHAPFAGKRHSADAKLAISISNLHARGHSIEDIAERHWLTYPQVSRIINSRRKRKKIVGNKKRKNYEILIQNPHSIAYQTEEE